MAPAARARAAALVAACLIVLAVDLALVRVDVFAWLPARPPATFFSGVTYQLSEAVHALYGGPPGPHPAVFIGNSQLDALVHPFDALAAALIAAGAPAGTPVRSLCVWGTAPTDTEVLTREMASMHPGAVVIGFGTPDVGTTLEQARDMPVTATLDVGWRNGMVPAADLEGRLDRWARTLSRLYRYRQLLRELVWPSDGWRWGLAPLPRARSLEEFLARGRSPEQVRAILALRDGFEHGERYEEALPYLLALNGREYVDGLRAKWRTLVPDALQLEALRRAAENVRRAGGRPVFVLLPENPLLDRDPEVGTAVRERSEAVARAVREIADEQQTPLVDFRRLLPREAFLDLNHGFLRDDREFKEPLARELAAVGALAE